MIFGGIFRNLCLPWYAEYHKKICEKIRPPVHEFWGYFPKSVKICEKRPQVHDFWGYFCFFGKFFDFSKDQGVFLAKIIWSGNKIVWSGSISGKLRLIRDKITSKNRPQRLRPDQIKNTKINYSVDSLYCEETKKDIDYYNSLRGPSQAIKIAGTKFLQVSDSSCWKWTN